VALDSALVMKLTDSLRDFAHELGQLSAAANKQLELLEQVRDELVALNEGLAGDDAGSDDDEDQDEEEESDDQEGAAEEKFPSWVPQDVRAAIDANKSNPAFWLELLSKMRNFSPAKNEAR